MIMTVKECIENRIAKLKEDKDRAEHCEMPDWVYAAELQCAIVELKNVLRFIDNSKEEHQKQREKEFAIAELEKIKEAAQDQMTFRRNTDKDCLEFSIDNMRLCDLIFNRISELKGENNEIL